MKLRTLLLGTAGAFVVAGGAQAADLSVAEPVESVRICDTFGKGFWYIPGSDTCLKIGGKVEFDVNVHDLAGIYSTHSSNYDFETKVGLNFTASSMTDYGRLDGYVALKGTIAHNSDSTGGNIVIDSAYLAIGALKAGYFDSLAKPDGGFADDVYRSDLAKTNALVLSWAAAGFGLALGLEDPFPTYGSSLPGFDDAVNVPLITGRISASQANWSGYIFGGFTEVDAASDSSWGIGANVTINLDSLAAGDKLRFNVAYGDSPFIGGGNYFTPAGIGYNDGWSAFVSLQHVLNATTTFDANYSYLQRVNDGTSAWRVGADLVWKPVTGFSARLGGQYIDDEANSDPSWSGVVALTRSW